MFLALVVSYWKILFVYLKDHREERGFKNNPKHAAKGTFTYHRPFNTKLSDTFTCCLNEFGTRPTRLADLMPSRIINRQLNIVATVRFSVLDVSWFYQSGETFGSWAKAEKQAHQSEAKGKVASSARLCGLTHSCERGSASLTPRCFRGRTCIIGCTAAWWTVHFENFLVCPDTLPLISDVLITLYTFITS